MDRLLPRKGMESRRRDRRDAFLFFFFFLGGGKTRKFRPRIRELLESFFDFFDRFLPEPPCVEEIFFKNRCTCEKRERERERERKRETRVWKKEGRMPKKREMDGWKDRRYDETGKKGTGEKEEKDNDNKEECKDEKLKEKS